MIPETSPRGPHTAARFKEADLLACWRRLFQVQPQHLDCQALPGDASTRQYFRIRPDDPAAKNSPASIILMQLEQPVEGEDIDFTRLLKFLDNLALPVPKLYAYDRDGGFLFLEDCGDETLEIRLANSDPDAVRSWYHQSVELLVDMQDRATKNIDPDCPAYHLRFDTAKLMWEMDFMLEHFVEGVLGHRWRTGQRDAIREPLQRLCEVLDRQPAWFAHRDYHSRNLMVRGNGLVLLDFQDARMGPAQYDLVSLLRDSYYRVPEDLVWEMVDVFLELKNRHSTEPIDREDFLRVFDLMSVQRNLKAVGTFAFQQHVMHNGRYQPYIEPTLATVRDTFGRRPECLDLQQRLGEVIPQLKP